MIVTVNGTMEQVMAAFGARFDDGHAPCPQRKRRAENEAQYKELTRKRRIIRRAFDLVRHDEDAKEAMDIFLRALTGKIAISDEVVERAEKTIAPR